MSDLTSQQVLILPGWLNSGPDHWQSRWQATHGYTRVDQHDWNRPLRGDWVTRLEEVVLAQKADCAITLVAHSLGCLLVAAWAALSRNTHRIQSAFLTAPCDLSAEGAQALLPMLSSWKPRRLSEQAVREQAVSEQPVLEPSEPGQSAQQTLPFRSLLLASQTDPYCNFEQARAMAAAWGSTLVDCGKRGHLNADSGLHNWPAGHDLLLKLQRDEIIDRRMTLRLAHPLYN